MLIWTSLNEPNRFAGVKDLLEGIAIVPFVFSLFAGFFAAVPSLLLVIWIEVNQRRSLPLAVVFGGLLAGITAILTLASLDSPTLSTPSMWVANFLGFGFSGVFGGAIYCLLAGRYSGMWLTRPFEMDK